MIRNTETLKDGWIKHSHNDTEVVTAKKNVAELKTLMIKR
jgi:hypothetical protein